MAPQSSRQLERRAALLTTILLCAGTLGFTGCSREFRVPQNYKTIQAAIDAASARDVIMIEPGTYVENITINKPELTIRGTDPDASKVVIQAKFGDGPVVSVRERDARLSNLTLTGGRRGIQIEASANNPSLFNLIVRDNSAQGLFVEAIASGELVESVVEGNGAAGVFIGGRAAFRLEGSRIIGNYDGVETLNATLEIRANLIQNNARCGLNIDDRSEVAGKDNVILGNGQDLCGAARSRDDLLDKSPPPPPSNLSVTPSEWTSQSRFTVDWENPKDIAGIVAYWFKVGTAPTRSTDGTRREIAEMPLVVENPPEGEQRVFVWLEDGMGNKREQNCAQGLIKFDRSPPEIIPVPNPPPNASGWNNSVVTVNFECWDRASHVTVCSDPVQIAEETLGRVVLGEAVDAAGNRAQSQITIKLDYTAPTIEVSEPQGELGDGGWYRSDVAVTATATDNLSGFANGQLRLEQTKRTMREGEDLRLSFMVEDLAGNRSEAQAGPFKVDKAPPTITAEPDRQPDSNGWYNHDVTVRFRCADTLSGISNCTSPVTVSSDGRDQAIQGEALDKAGNRATAAIRISLDKTPPTGSLTINDGAATTIETTVTLHITSDDNLSGVTQMRFSNDGQTWSGWESFNSTRSNWDLARFGGSVSTLGPKTVYAQLRDAAGNESRPFSATVRLTLATFRGHSKGVRVVAFSPDGRFLASGSGDNTVKLWEVATGQEVRTFLGSSVAFSPDGQLLASGYGNTVEVWEVATGKEVLALGGHSGAVNSVAFSPDGRFVASGSSDYTVKLWEVATGRLLLTLKGFYSYPVRSVAFSPDGQLLASDLGRTVEVWEVATGKEVYTLHGHSGSVYEVAFSPDGRFLASGADDWTVKLWEVATGKEVYTLHGHSGSVYSVAFSPDGRFLASGSDDWTVKVWEVATGRQLQTLRGYSGAVWSVAFSPDGRLLASGCSDATIKLRDVSDLMEQ